MAKWIEFLEIRNLPKERKTKVWGIYPKGCWSNMLGQIKWYSKWRKYAFTPIPDIMVETFFEADCLRDIADFCEEKTQEHKAAKKVA